MTEPFMRVDLSQNSRDFQPVAMEPGVPLLDRSNSNYQTLRKWLGAFVAEFERERAGDRVSFYVRDQLPITLVSGLWTSSLPPVATTLSRQAVTTHALQRRHVVTAAEEERHARGFYSDTDDEQRES